jgi:Tol biopolymer transport system component
MALPSLLLALAAAAAPAGRPIGPDDLFTIKNLAGPRLSPDGRFVAYTVQSYVAKSDESDTDIYMSPIEGGEPVRLATTSKDETEPRFSPDGRYIAFLTEREDDEETQVYLLDRRGGEARRLTEAKGGVSALEWSPDSTRLALVVEDPPPAAAKASAEEKSESGKEKRPVPIVTRRRQFNDDERGWLTDRRRHIHIVTVATGAITPLTFGPFDDGEPAWSPDGKWVAFASNRTPDPDGNFDTDIFVAAVDAKPGEHPRLLTTSPAADTSPAWSPDGRFIA